MSPDLLPRRRSHRLRRFRRFLPVLRPSAGRRLPRELRADRVSTLAGALPLGVEDPGFEILLRRIDSAPLLGGNQVVPFFSGDEAFAAMRQAVAHARREILLESYIFRDDGTGRRLFGELALAAGRGVSVRVLTDAVGSFSTAASFWRHMESRGIRVRIFHPLFSHIWYQPFRDHRKILVVDRETGFTGGMNIGEEYGSFRIAKRTARKIARKVAPRMPG
ncbi:MAG TPA: phospholipase D-like domain-containing protein, partial [Thermoanaerobaculia bacterium]|nr:phospholipase D-like domain-containing protein [Thermoanaerobaculia bacterium]